MVVVAMVVVVALVVVVAAVAGGAVVAAGSLSPLSPHAANRRVSSMTGRSTFRLFTIVLLREIDE